MTLLFCEGWDHYLVADIVRKWANHGYSQCIPTIHATAGRRGSPCHYNPSDQSANCWVRFETRTFASDDVFIIGTAFLASGFAYNSTNGGTGMSINLNGGEQIGWYVNPTGTITVRRGDFNDTSLGTSGVVLTPNTWHYIELKATIHNSAGSYELRVDGVNVRDASGIDTQKQSTSLANQMQIWKFPYNVAIRFDDMYMCNGLGSENNDFLGDIRVDSLFPDGAGASTDWTPSAGSNYDCVNEAAPNDDTDYVSETTAGDHDTYAFDNLPTSGGDVMGVQTMAFARKDDAGTRDIKLMTRPSSTDYESDIALPLLDTWTYYMDMREQNPETTSPWTISEVNASEFGVKLES